MMMRRFLMAALTVAFVAIATPAPAQEMQTVTVRLIPCASRPSETPLFGITDSGRHTRHFEGTQGAQAVWVYTFRLAPGTYSLSATIPYKPGHPGCVYLTRFAVLSGHDRQMVGALARPSRIGGENYYRSIYGTLPFLGMNVTIQPTDYPNAPEILVPVDGTMYDAELLGPHQYQLRFYLTPQDVEGTKFSRVQIDFRMTSALTTLRRDLTATDLASAASQ